jgi:hypothetical protein
LPFIGWEKNIFGLLTGLRMNKQIPLKSSEPENPSNASDKLVLGVNRCLSEFIQFNRVVARGTYGLPGIMGNMREYVGEDGRIGVAAAAKYHKVHPDTIREWIDKKWLPAKRRGPAPNGHWRIRPEDLEMPYSVDHTKVAA